MKTMLMVAVLAAGWVDFRWWAIAVGAAMIVNAGVAWAYFKYLHDKRAR